MKKYAKKRSLSSLLAFTMLMSSMTCNNVTIFADDVVDDADVVVSGEAVAADAAEEAAADEAAETMVEDYLEVVGDTTSYGTVVDNKLFMSDAAVEAGTVIFDNDYATVYAGQNLQFDAANDDLIAAGKDPADLTFGDVAFTSKVRTSGVNTKAAQTNDASDPATNLGAFKLSSNQRVAYKVVSKQACKITAYASGGNHVLFLDSGTAEAPNVTLGSTDVAQGPATILGGIAGTGSVSADIDGNQIAYFSGQGTNDNFLGIKVEAGSAVINPTVRLTLDGEAVTEPVDVSGSGFKFDGASATGADGSYSFNGLATYDYTLTVVKDGVTYQGVFKADADGSYESTLDLQVIAADTGLTITDASGAVLTDQRVVLDYVDGYTPKRVETTTNEDGLAQFNLVFGEYNVTVPGYTLDNSVYAPAKGALSATLTATPADLPAIPTYLKAQSNALFVGFAPEEGTTAYYYVSDALKDAAEGSTIYVASGEYFEKVSIDKSVSIIGVGDTKPHIFYNDSQQGGDTNGGKNFHGDTVAVNAAEARVYLENLVIENSAEASIPGIVQNSTALSSCYNASANIITVKECDIVSTRDTIYSGKSNCTDTWTFIDCDIYGFQDVVCGGGNVDIMGGRWVLNMDSDARLLVPQCRTDENITTMTADGFEVVLADQFVAKGSTNTNDKPYTAVEATNYTDAAWTCKAYLGRAWGNGSASAATTQCIVSNYTDTAGAIEVGAFNGYDSSEASATPDTIKNADWLVALDADNDVYLTTRWQNVNKFNKELSGNTVRGSYQIVGDFNEELKEDIDGVGFAIFDEDGNYVGAATNKSAYTIKGS
ncbi:MAG: hypothetical protein IJR45_04700 [Firmicutes bacterium]|nr:hypothetical protein [Bacillota bacterium]